MSTKQILKRFVTRMARARGYEIIPDWDIPDLPIARHLREVFAAYKIDCVIDVGANLGQFYNLLRRRVGYTGQVLSVEPVRQYADNLKRQASGETAWRILAFALGACAGEVQINVTKSPGLNSILQPRRDKLPQFWKSDSIAHVETVMVQTLDELLLQEQVDCAKRSVYLKMDTQGFDLEVVKGAVNSLTDIRALQTEASILPIYEGAPNFRTALDVLNDRDFEISAMFPVTLDDALRLIEFDCIMVNKRFAAGILLDRGGAE